MEGGPPMFRQNFTCSALLKDYKEFSTRYRAITYYGGHFPEPSAFLCINITGLIPVRSPLLGEVSVDLSFPQAT